MNDSEKDNNIYIREWFSQDNLGDVLSHTLYSALSQKTLIKLDMEPVAYHLVYKTLLWAASRAEAESGSFEEYTKLAYLCAGSILKLTQKNDIVMGTGFIRANDAKELQVQLMFLNSRYKLDNKPHKILSVRGPKTRDALLSIGVDCPEVYGDPLIAFPLVYDKEMDIEYDIGIIPHYIDKDAPNFLALKEKLSKKYKINIIDIKIDKNRVLGAKHFVNEVKKCRLIISSSLHGVIFGIVYNRKTIFTEFSDNVAGERFKFYDFFGSMGIDYDFLPFDPHASEIGHELHRLLQNTIKVNNKGFKKVGIDIVDICPFIDPDRKKVLTDRWTKYSDTILPN